MALSFSKVTTQYRVKSPASYSSTSTFPCTELGCYSIDKDGTLHNNDRRELRSLKTKLNDKQLFERDLSDGFTPSKGDYFFKNIKRPLDALLYWTVQNKGKLLKEDDTGENKRLDVDFVLTCGTVKRLLATVFNTGKFKTATSWKMYAVKYNGTIYISHVEEVRPQTGGDIEELKKNCYMGKQFEMVISEALTQDTSSANGDKGTAVEGRQGFYSVSVGTFGGRHRLLTRSEVDGIENGTYIEMKMCIEYTGQEEWKFPMNKLRDWWYHMYAGDMKKIIYGIRDRTRLVGLSRLDRESIPSQIQYPTMSCPPRVGQALSSWDPRSCVGFADDFLQWLKGIVVEDAYEVSGPVVQYELEWNVGLPEEVSCTRAEAANVLLPTWFTQEMSLAFQGQTALDSIQSSISNRHITSNTT
ncbi:decapping and exoribonuclease protein-like [Montipora capricornis]|uniref:decapping and exoribonuclease protein-like n=1 Tax=Montipora capricornis TaxID=246305 RepID=UPI0035F1058E